MKKKRFIIVSGRVTRGGTLVLSVLCKLLREKGYRAKMFYMNSVPTKDTDWKKWWLKQFYSSVKIPFIRLLCAINKNSQKEIYKNRRELLYTPIKGLPVKYLPFYNKKNTIVVYPEIVYGNFLKADHVVRYLLYHNHLYDPKDEKSYGKNDLFIAFREVFNDPVLNPNDYVVQLNWFDHNLYRQYNFSERSGACYILRKGKTRPDCPAIFDGPVIDYGTSEEEVVRIFNECKYCYSYDTQTFYTTIAAVCGCIPIIVPELGKTPEDYPKMPGKALGNSPEQIQQAIDTRDELLKRLDLTQKNEKNLLQFIHITESFFS